MPAVTEMSRCFTDARDDSTVGVVILTGENLAFNFGCQKQAHDQGTDHSPCAHGHTSHPALLTVLKFDRFKEKDAGWSALKKCCQWMSCKATSCAGAGSEAFCSGGDQSVRGIGGYVGADSVPRLNVLDLQAMLYFSLCKTEHVRSSTTAMCNTLLVDQPDMGFC